MPKTILDLTAATNAVNADQIVLHQSGVDKRASLQTVFENVHTILPAATDTYDLGSAAARFREIHAEEVFVGASSLYVNGKKVVEDASDVMTFATDTDQAIMLKTVATSPGSGNSNITIQAGNEINVEGPGGIEFTVGPAAASKNITFSNASTGGQIQFTGVTQVNGDLTITGGLTVAGTTTTVDTENLLIEDNLITINKNQTGTPAGTLVGGIDVERGDETNYRFVFEEATDTFKIGMQGDLQPVATREETPVDGGLAMWDAATNRFITIDASIPFFTSAASFPASPKAGDECYRTDLDGFYKYNGAAWLQI